MQLCRLLCVLMALAVPVAAGAARQDGVLPLPPAGGLSVPASLEGTDIERALRAREWERAGQLLAAEIERRPEAAELLVLAGRVFLIDRKPLNAAIALKKAEALGPIDNASRFTLVLAYLSLGRSDWARPELERLAASEPSNNTYQYWLGRLDYDAGRYASAVSRFEAVLARDPGFVRAHDNLGLCHEALHRPERAILHYRRAIELNRQAAAKSPWPALNLGILLRQRGELGEAEALLREALEYDPAFAQGRYHLGVLLEQRGLLDEAVAELTQAAALDAAYAQPHYALARIHRRQGRLAAAHESLATFKTLSEDER